MKYWDFPGGTVAKNPPANQGTQIQSLVQQDFTHIEATEPVHHNYYLLSFIIDTFTFSIIYMMESLSVGFFPVIILCDVIFVI